MDLYALFSTIKSQLDILLDVEVSEADFSKNTEVFSFTGVERTTGRKIRISGHIENKEEDSFA